MNGLWKCGIVALASIVQSFGLTLQRLSHIDRQVAASSVDEEQLASRSVLLWRTGIALLVLANIFGSTVQLTMLPLVLVSTLQSIGIVANSFFATFVLGEPLTTRHVFGTVLVTIGAIIVATLGNPQTDPDVSLGQLLRQYVRPPFLIYMWCTVAVGVSLVLLSRRLRSHPVLRGCLWGIVGGLASAHSLLMAKLAVGQLVHDFTHCFQLFSYAQYWVILLLFLFFAIFQMWCVYCGLQFASTAVLYPLVFCVYNVTTLVNSGMLYGNAMFKKSSIPYIAFGTLVLLCGVLLLSSRFEGDWDQEFTQYDTPNLQLDTSIDSYSPLAASGSSPRSETGSTILPGRRNFSGSSRRDFSGSSRRDFSGSSRRDFSGPSYTSFDTLNPAITNPDKQRGRHNRMSLSKEQQKILHELGI